MDYLSLRNQNGDTQRHLSVAAQRTSPWELINMLPVLVEIWVSRVQFHTQPQPNEPESPPVYVSSLIPNQRQKLPFTTLTEGDTLYVCVRDNTNTLLPLLQPYTVRNIWRAITLGSVEYSSDGGHNEVQASNWDLRGVWIKNRAFVPLNIYYKGRLAAQVFAHNGIGYMGGGASDVYFDNDREGLKFGDKIEFSFSVKGLEDKRMVAILDDTQALTVFVGKISGGDFKQGVHSDTARVGLYASAWGPEPDFGVYRIAQPSFSGLTYYFSGKEQYRTYPTNPMW